MASIDVLVVGAGPTGLTLAGELLRRGVRLRIVDKAPAPTTQSRAIAVHARTLEIFDELGIAESLVARGVAATGVTMSSAGHVLAELDFGDLPTKFPFALCVSQVETEAVLESLLERRGGRVERGTTFASMVETGEGIEAKLVVDGREEIVTASYVVGCDGAHSAIRHQVGATFDGHTYEETFVLADVRIAEGTLPTDRMSTFFAPDGVAALFPMQDHRFRIIVTAPATDDLASPTLADVRRLVEARAGRAVGMSDAVWIAPFRIHCRQVVHYRHGRVFLAGDAAHIHSPIGGQGMNTGIQDAHNLGWKLALVVKGLARPALLDSYEPERHAIGRHVLEQTDRATKVGMLKGVLAPIRNQVARVVSSFEMVRRRLMEETAELTVGYESSPIAKEWSSSALSTRFARPETSEKPTVGSRFAFTNGPRAGARAPDVPLLDEDGAPRELSKVLAGGALTLLLCDGRSASDDGYRTFVDIAERATRRWPDLVRPYLVTPQTKRPLLVPPSIPFLHDSGDFERTYAAQTECVYLVRPDLYVGFRSQPADADALESYLAELLV